MLAASLVVLCRLSVCLIITGWIPPPATSGVRARKLLEVLEQYMAVDSNVSQPATCCIIRLTRGALVRGEVEASRMKSSRTTTSAPVLRVSAPNQRAQIEHPTGGRSLSARGPSSNMLAAAFNKCVLFVWLAFKSSSWRRPRPQPAESPKVSSPARLGPSNKCAECGSSSARWPWPPFGPARKPK